MVVEEEKMSQQINGIAKNTGSEDEKNNSGNHVNLPKQDEGEEKIHYAQEVNKIIDENFYLFVEGGKHLIISRENIERYANFQGQLNPFKKEDQLLAVERVVIKKLGVFDTVKELCKNELERFLREAVPKDSIGFDPDGTDENVINSYPTKAKIVYKGKDKPLEEFKFPRTDELIIGLSNNNKQKALYLHRFNAHLIQKPGEKPRILLIFMSEEEGTGKGTFHTLLEKMLGNLAYSTNDPEMVLGAYGDILMRSLVITFDEANLLYKKQYDAKVKNLVSEPKLTVRKIYGAPGQIKSCHRVMALTNDKKIKKTSKTNRRDVYYTVDPNLYKNTELFDKLYEEAWNPNHPNYELEEYVGWLKKLDISGWNPAKDRPATDELDKQKASDFDGIDLWVFDIANLGKITRHRFDKNGKSEKYNEIFRPNVHITTEEIVNILTTIPRYKTYNADQTVDNSFVKRQCEKIGLKHRQKFKVGRGATFPHDLETFRLLAIKFLGLSKDFEFSTSIEEYQQDIEIEDAVITEKSQENNSQ